MIIEGTGLEGKEVTLYELNHILEGLGFAHWTWDYRRATFDYKYHDYKTNNNIYLRVPCEAVNGQISDVPNETIVKLGEPYIGKHIYPHGFDYEFNFPAQILQSAQRKLQTLNENLEQVALNN